MQTVDFQKMLKEARIEAGILNRYEIKEISPIFMFNMLQDSLPVCILDFRFDFDYLHIRNSITPEKLEQFQKQNQKCNRIVLITDPQTNPNIEIENYQLSLNSFLKLYQIMGGFQEFYNKYPFMCVSESQMSPEDIQLASERYPSEIVPDEIYLGDLMNATSSRQLQNLRIISCVDLTGSNPTESLNTLSLSNEEAQSQNINLKQICE